MAQNKNTKTEKVEAVGIEITAPDIRQFEVAVIGDSRLVIHRWSEKAKKIILDKQMGKARGKKDRKIPEEDFKDAQYVSTKGWQGIPSASFKKSMVGACRYVEGLPMTQARGVLRVLSEGTDKRDGTDLVRLYGDGPHMREDMVRIDNGKTTDIRHRPEFRTWHCWVTITYNNNIISEEQLMNLLSLAGLHVGIMEGRPGAPKNTMDWGTFHIAGPKELKKLKRKAA